MYACVCVAVKITKYIQLGKKVKFLHACKTFDTHITHTKTIFPKLYICVCERESQNKIKIYIQLGKKVKLLHACKTFYTLTHTSLIPKQYFLNFIFLGGVCCHVLPRGALVCYKRGPQINKLFKPTFLLSQ